MGKGVGRAECVQSLSMLTGKSSITYHLGQCDAEDLGCEEVLVNSFSMLTKKSFDDGEWTSATVSAGNAN